MPDRIYSFERPERFVVGTVGQPGERTFFLQVSRRGETISVSLEKEQVAALAEGVDTLLREAGQVAPAPAELYADRAPLDAPVVEEFRVGDMSVAWTGDEVVMEAAALELVDESEVADEAEVAELQAATEDGPDLETLADALQDGPTDADIEAELAAITDEEDEEPGALLRVALAPEAARAFVQRAQLIVSAGRKPCIWCGRPLDADRHVCPRMN